MTVSDVLLKILHAHGVRHLFGISGDAINDVTDAVRRQDDIAFISVSHEEAGAFAASAQAKLTGELCGRHGRTLPCPRGQRPRGRNDQFGREGGDPGRHRLCRSTR